MIGRGIVDEETGHRLERRLMHIVHLIHIVYLHYKPGGYQGGEVIEIHGDSEADRSHRPDAEDEGSPREKRLAMIMQNVIVISMIMQDLINAGPILNQTLMFQEENADVHLRIWE